MPAPVPPAGPTPATPTLATPTLVAVAHGSRSEAAAVATGALLTAVRRARPDLVVVESYLDHAEPSLASVAAGLTGPAVVVPLLLGAAFHSRVDVPAALEPARSRGLDVWQAEVLGPDDVLLAGLERRLGEVGVTAGDPAVAVVLAAAGSAEAASCQAVRDLATSWRARGWWAVEPAYASAAPPTISDAVASLRRSGAPRVVAATYLLFPGLFADQVAAAGAEITSAPLADAAEVVELVLRRYDETLAAASTDEARLGL